jgi:signal transduction histidine kinase
MSVEGDSRGEASTVAEVDRIRDILLEARMQHIPGTGLGLSIEQAIIEQHGGQVYCRSQTGQGSTFGFRLPLGEE